MRASTAWADESFQEHDTTGFYIIAAVIIPASAQEPARAQMLQAQARHAPAKLHWVARDDKERLELAYTVAEIEGLHVVAVGSPVHQRRQERARAYCLHQLVLELHGFGVEQLFMEARQPTLNTRDITTVQHARYTLPKGTHFRIDHLPGAGEALLWVADIVAGAVRAEKLGDPRYREILGDRVIDFPVRVL
ncbi:hypothetical protein AB0B54_30615 [Microbispora bryophytorum]|uniref:hypothetical protein n=1 Tax=Microbispora bryophytorum TaxID=1460882 RepID=UPI0033EEA6E0